MVEGVEDPPRSPVCVRTDRRRTDVAVRGRARRRGDPTPYADAGYYGDITHPTERLVDLLTEVAIRIGGADDYLKARAVTRLDQGMGGGKSHACIGAYHLAAHPEALWGTELGKQVAARAKAKMGRPINVDLHNPTLWFCRATT